MREYEIDANGKINIAIDVIEKRQDGYHNIEAIMHSIKLHDTLRITKKLSGITIECNNKNVPFGRENLAYKAAEIIRSKFNIKDGVRIVIKKRIPVSAGLGGGSSDAAACLKAMNQMFCLGLKSDELVDLGRLIGADVPFCVLGETAFAQGKGDILTRIECKPKINIILIKPDIRISTEWAYNNLTLGKTQNKPDIRLLINALTQNNIKYVAANMRNAFEGLIERFYPQVKHIKNALNESGAIGSIMSGSGPTVFGIYEDVDVMEKAYEEFCGRDMECFIEKPDSAL